MRDGVLTVRWSGVKVDVVLQKIAGATGLAIEVGPGVAALTFGNNRTASRQVGQYVVKAGDVPQSFSGNDVESIVGAVISQIRSYELEVRYFHEGSLGARKLTGVSVVLRGQPRILEEDLAGVLRGMERRERELGEQLAAVSLGGDPLGKALAEFLAAAKDQAGDPRSAATPQEKRVGALLRQSTAATPEEKRLLKVVLMDPRFGRLEKDLGSALLHAIQSRPEPEDAELILDAMRKHLMMSPPFASWVFSALPEAWDDRFTPYLIEGIRSESFWWIQAAGESGAAAKAAVPALEGVQNSDDGIIQRAAAEALQAITGKEYPIPPSPIQQHTLAENIRRALDPQTPKREREAIARDLPEYDLRPGDKRVLAAALAEEERGRNRTVNPGLLAALEKTFVDAMKEQRDPGDSEVILDLLLAGSGRAYDFLDDRWDDRFIPFIVRDAGGGNQQRNAFLICGKYRLEVCKTALQAGLTGQNREDAARAMALITGK